MDLDEHSMSVCDAYKIMFSVTSVRMADVNKFCDAEFIFTGLIPGLLCEFVRRAHFGVEEVGKQLAL